MDDDGDLKSFWIRQQTKLGKMTAVIFLVWLKYSTSGNFSFNKIYGIISTEIYTNSTENFRIKIKKQK